MGMSDIKENIVVSDLSALETIKRYTISEMDKPCR